MNDQNYQTLLNKYANYVRSTLKSKPAGLESGFEAQLPPPKKTFNIVFVAAAVIFVGILLSIYLRFSLSKTTPPPPLVSSPTVAPADMGGTYRNSDYNFEIEYPSTFTVVKPEMPYYRLPSALLSLKNADLNSYLTVAFDPDSGGCGESKEGWETTIINDISFSHRANSSAGAGDQYYSDFYRTTIKDKCFEIAAIVHIKATDTGTSSGRVLAARDELKQLVSTFILTP